MAIKIYMPGKKRAYTIYIRVERVIQMKNDSNIAKGLIRLIFSCRTIRTDWKPFPVYNYVETKLL